MNVLVNMGNVTVGNEILFDQMHVSRIDCNRMTDSNDEKQSLRLSFFRYTPPQLRKSKNHECSLGE